MTSLDRLILAAEDIGELVPFVTAARAELKELREREAHWLSMPTVDDALRPLETKYRLSKRPASGR